MGYNEALVKLITEPNDGVSLIKFIIKWLHYNLHYTDDEGTEVYDSVVDVEDLKQLISEIEEIYENITNT